MRPRPMRLDQGTASMSSRIRSRSAGLIDHRARAPGVAPASGDSPIFGARKRACSRFPEACTIDMGLPPSQLPAARRPCRAPVRPAGRINASRPCECEQFAGQRSLDGRVRLRSAYRSTPSRGSRRSCCPRR